MSSTGIMVVMGGLLIMGTSGTPWGFVPPAKPANSPLVMVAGQSATGAQKRVCRVLAATGRSPTVECWRATQPRPSQPGPGAPRRPGGARLLRPPAGSGRRHDAPRPASGRPGGDHPDRQRQRADPQPVPPVLLAARSLRHRPAGPRPRPVAPQARGVLGPRGEPRAAGHVAAAGLPHAARPARRVGWHAAGGP